ncbi:MAG: hypothetical protein GQ569_14055 [Methylococcaceae bacterium]|nr:hypothetical protein [Methylococcaceae bacterium]
MRIKSKRLLIYLNVLAVEGLIVMIIITKTKEAVKVFQNQLKTMIH